MDAIEIGIEIGPRPGTRAEAAAGIVHSVFSAVADAVRERSRTAPERDLDPLERLMGIFDMHADLAAREIARAQADAAAADLGDEDPGPDLEPADPPPHGRFAVVAGGEGADGHEVAMDFRRSVLRRAAEAMGEDGRDPLIGGDPQAVGIARAVFAGCAAAPEPPAPRGLPPWLRTVRVPA